jgi:DNA polymerase-4
MINHESPKIMFIDLNSAFATTEQQAHPTLRGRPVGVTNRISKYCCVIACSYEAKALGIKVGMNYQEALALSQDFVMLESDPPKYTYVYKKIMAIMASYSPNIQMKSIDEGIIDFHGVVTNGKTMEQIGYEIKRRVRDEIGDYMKINVGIAPNRFLAKQAANWHKPDGLDIIDHNNLLDYYGQIKRRDITGIAKKFERRLNQARIYTPLDFLNAPSDYLKRMVFHSIVGEDWHNRLHGWEVDSRPTTRRQVGRQFVLDKRTNSDEILVPRLLYLCETTGKKLRFIDMSARKITIWAYLQNGGYWKAHITEKQSFYTDQDICARAVKLFSTRPKHMIVSTIGITCSKLEPSNRMQSSLLPEINKREDLITAIDEINERYGIFMIHSLSSLPGKKIVKQKIPFASVNYLDMLFR